MKAIVSTKHGRPDVLQLQEVEQPAPKDDEVLIKVHAVGLNSADWRMLVGDPFFLRIAPVPPILGADVAGVVEAVGRGVRQFQPGDEVYGDLSARNFGGLAEYACAGESLLAPKPAGLSFEQAAALPMAAMTALQGLRDAGKLRAGQQVLIHGASGGVGTYAVQLAKAFGAEVTAVCSARSAEQARALGADHVIDYRQEDFTRRPQRYDLILGVNGYRSIIAYRRALKPGGTYVMIGGGLRQLFQGLLLGGLLSRLGSKKMAALMAKTSQKDLLALNELVAAGKLMPVIDRCYPLHEAPAAFRYLGEDHARGKVVVTVHL